MPNKTDIITSNLDEERALHGKSLALGKLHKSIVGTDVEGKIDNYFMFLGGVGQAPFSLEYLHPPLECCPLRMLCLGMV